MCDPYFNAAKDTALTTNPTLVEFWCGDALFSYKFVHVKILRPPLRRGYANFNARPEAARNFKGSRGSRSIRCAAEGRAIFLGFARPQAARKF